VTGLVDTPLYSGTCYFQQICDVPHYYQAKVRDPSNGIGQAREVSGTIRTISLPGDNRVINKVGIRTDLIPKLVDLFAGRCTRNICRHP
jgi:hypothetical protein